VQKIHVDLMVVCCRQCTYRSGKLVPDIELVATCQTGHVPGPTLVAEADFVDVHKTVLIGSLTYNPKTFKEIKSIKGLLDRHLDSSNQNYHLP
jgi:hypothetical protein